MAGAVFQSHDRKPYMDAVRDFLHRGTHSTTDNV
jgi:hypothetical protein